MLEKFVINNNLKVINLNVDQSLDQAFKCYSSKKYTEAKKIYSEIIAVKPSHPTALHFLGLLAYRKGQVEVAVSLIEKAIFYKENYAEAYYNLGNIFRWKGKIDKAIVSYARAIRIKSNYASSYFAIAALFAQQGKIKEAIGGYQRVLSLKPKNAEAHNYLGLAYLALEKFQSAVVSFKNAVTIKSNYTEALMNLALTHKKMGDLESAIEIYRKSLVISPDQAKVHNNLGNALREQGRNEEALNSYKKAFAINPEIQNTRHFLNALSGKTTDKAPREYIERVFDTYAGNFEQDLLLNLSYDTPKLLKKRLKKLGLLNSKFNKAADLGCGTGLAGVEFKAFANYWVGIDLSTKMLVEARKKKVYDEVLANEIIDGLEATNLSFDLFVATDVFIYTGNLSLIFECVNKHATNGALFIFSTEHLETGSFELNLSGRYAHSQKYITVTSRSFGFTLVDFSRINLRKEHNSWIVGALYILKKG